MGKKVKAVLATAEEAPGEKLEDDTNVTWTSGQIREKAEDILAKMSEYEGKLEMLGGGCGLRIRQ